MYSKHGVTLLNAKQEIRVGKVWHSWESLCLRAPQAYDVILAGKPQKEFANSVFYSLHSLLPRATNSDFHNQLVKFLKQVDGVAAPVMMI